MDQGGKPFDEARAWEPVHVEHEWYDGPVAGLADVHGKAHYFRRVNDYNRHAGTDDHYDVWPATPEAVQLELENWRRFAAWNERFEAGESTVETHPGQGGIDVRYDEIEHLLSPHRQSPPDPTKRLTATWRSLDGPRYPSAGPLYLVQWSSIDRTPIEPGSP